MLLIKDAVYKSRLLQRLLRRLLRRLPVERSLSLIMVAAIYKEGSIHSLTGVFLLLCSD